VNSLGGNITMGRITALPITAIVLAGPVHGTATTLPLTDFTPTVVRMVRAVTRVMPAAETGRTSAMSRNTPGRKDRVARMAATTAIALRLISQASIAIAMQVATRTLTAKAASIPATSTTTASQNTRSTAIQTVAIRVTRVPKEIRNTSRLTQSEATRTNNSSPPGDVSV
jgi:hypothetical protein